MFLPFAGPMYYQELLANPEDTGTLREVVQQHYPQLPSGDPTMVEWWPALDSAHRAELERITRQSQREQFTVGFGFGAVAALGAIYLISRIR